MIESFLFNMGIVGLVVLVCLDLVRLYYDNSKYLEEKARLPMPDGIHCVICGGKLPKFKRKYCSEDCFQGWYEGLAIRSWISIRNKVLERDKYICQECHGKVIPNNRSTYMEAHHINAICDGGAEFLPANCITLCHECHKGKHSKTGNVLRKNKTLKQYMEG